GHLLGAFGPVDQFSERLGNVGKKSDTVFLDQLAKKRLDDRRTSKTAGQFGQHADLVVDAERRRSDDMPKGRRVLDRLSQAVEGTPRRFDIGLIEKLEERLSVTSRNCRLYHCSNPLMEI